MQMFFVVVVVVVVVVFSMRNLEFLNCYIDFGILSILKSVKPA